MEKSTLMKEILKEYQAKRLKARSSLEARRQEVFDLVPIIEEIYRQIKSLGIKSAQAILQGQDIDVDQEMIDLNDAIQGQLLKHGYPADYLELTYECDKCKDTGYLGQEKCSCLNQRLAREYYKMSNLDKVLEEENFINFDFDIFSDEIHEGEGLSPRARIGEIYDASIDFINKFEDPQTYNLLFYGPTGLGKTYMLNSIAKDLMDMGYTVVYQTAHNLMTVIEEYKFSKTDNILEAKDKYNMLMETDLLIIDDLGSENSNSFSNSEIFNIINSRNIGKKKILISTNLSPGEISRRYTDRIYSRILDNFMLYKFFGRDLRWS